MAPGSGDGSIGPDLCATHGSVVTFSRMKLTAHCKRGHEFTAENTRVETDRKGRVQRRCLACAAQTARSRRAKNKKPRSPVLVPVRDSWEKRANRRGINECWLWTGKLHTTGYGCLVRNGKRLYAHRLSLEFHSETFDESLFVLHRCDVRQCVNPHHLFQGTHTDNMRDAADKGRLGGVLRSRTHCRRGHEYSPENTYIVPPDGSRRCRACARHCRREQKARVANGSVR